MPDRWDEVFSNDGLVHGYLRTKLRGLQKAWKHDRTIQWEDLIEYIGEDRINSLSDSRIELLREAWFRMTSQGKK